MSIIHSLAKQSLPYQTLRWSIGMSNFVLSTPLHWCKISRGVCFDSSHRHVQVPIRAGQLGICAIALHLLVQLRGIRIYIGTSDSNAAMTRWQRRGASQHHLALSQQ